MSKATNTAPSYYQPPRDSLPAAPWTHINPVARGPISSAHPRDVEAVELTSEATKIPCLKCSPGWVLLSCFLMGWSDISVSVDIHQNIYFRIFMHFKCHSSQSDESWLRKKTNHQEKYLGRSQIVVICNEPGTAEYHVNINVINFLSELNRQSCPVFVWYRLQIEKSLVSDEHNAREQCCSNTIIGLAFTGPSPL